jgi:RNA polymerase sigma factor (sigma-70 family)
MKNIDKNILIRAQKGDLSAFEHILSFYEKAIYNYCLRITKNSANAKDATQETFIKVYTHSKNINPEKNIKTWIFTIATNTVYDLLRSKKRKNEVNLDENVETIDNLHSYYKEEGKVKSSKYLIATAVPNLEFFQFKKLVFPTKSHPWRDTVQRSDPKLMSDEIMLWTMPS